MPVLDLSRRVPVSRRLLLPGWAPSRWGWDASLECYWARLVPLRSGDPVVEVSQDHLVPTLSSLARAVATLAGLDAGLVFVALTGGTAFTAGPVPHARQAGAVRPA